jgi:CRP-like cAMP-binding protein
MKNRFLALRQLISQIEPFSETEWQAFSEIWTPFEAKRKELLTGAGEKEKHLYFVSEGVQRVFYLDDENREATIVFTYAPSFGGVLDSFLKQQPSRFFYETLTPSTFLRTSFTEFERLMSHFPAVEKMVRSGLTDTLAGVLERLVELQCYSSEERFKKLLQRSPHILHLVPHRYLANYIGIDPTNFSKLINKVKI